MSDYESLKVTELKTLLKERQIPASGLTRKAQFIQALVEDDEKAQTAESAENHAETIARVTDTTDNNAPAEEVAEETKDEPQTAATDLVTETAADAPPAVSQDSDERIKKGGDVEEMSAKPEPASVESPAGVDRKRKRSVEEEGPDATPKKAKTQAEEVKEQNVQDSKAVAEQDTIQDVDMPEAEVQSNEPMSDEAVESTTLPSTYPPTSALYVRNLMRPLQAQAFRSDLQSLTGSAEDAITDLHMDFLKTHAFIVCSSRTVAIRVRKALHDKPWPQHESGRKALWVDFIPEDKVKDWIDEEQRAGRDVRFEVTYDQDSAGNNIAKLSEVFARSAAPREQPPAPREPQREPVSQGQGMPGAPSGPRGHRAQRQPPPAEATPKAQSNSFNKLDQYFQFTTAKPKIYYQPVDKDLADRRLDELDRETGRDWDNGRSWNRSTRLAPIDQLRRYTFDDGDRVVDGGMDFGGFGRMQGAGGSGSFNPNAPRGGRGRGGYRP